MSAGPELEKVGSVTFQVAPGDPDAISGAAIWHEQISSQMNTHAQSITNATSAALSRWQGDAAASYQALSGQMTAAFKAGEIRARETAQTMHAIARDLDRYQQEGEHALKQGNQWMQKAAQDYQNASDLQTRLQSAKSDLAGLQAQMQNQTEISAHAGPSPNVGPLPGEISAAQTKVNTLESQLRQAKQTLHESNQQIRKWDHRGQQAWEDAEDTVARFTTIPVGQIAPPPMPGVPVPAPTHSSGGILGALGHFFGGVPGDLDSAGKWVIHTAPGVLLKAGEYTLLTASGPVGVLVVTTVEGTKLVSALTGKTIGVCLGGSAQGGGVEVQGTACLESTPDGGSAVMLTGGGGVGVGTGASGFGGVLVSNGKTPDAQGGAFDEVGSGAGDGLTGGSGSYAWGKDKGKPIWDASGGWAPGVGQPVTGHAGVTETKVIPVG